MASIVTARYPRQRTSLTTASFDPYRAAFFAGTINCDFEHLFEYDGTRYHYVLDYNMNVKNCIENRHLQKLFDGTDADDDDRADEQMCACFELFWPFIQPDQEVRMHPHQVGGHNNRNENSSVVRIQLCTVNGKLQATEHDRIMNLPSASPVGNDFPNLKVFVRSDFTNISRVEHEIFRVTVGTTEYCVKTLRRAADSETFLRELRVLSKIPIHPHVIELLGVVEAKRGMIDGFLVPYISGGNLRELNSITASQKKNWKKQIEDTVTYLHEKDIVWGDAKPRNVLISEKKDKVVLIDFGDGWTKGWVDAELSGTKQGDLQGMERIFQFLDALSVSTEHSENKE